MAEEGVVGKMKDITKVFGKLFQYAGAFRITILLSAVLTGFSIYDDIAKVAGAGTLVPITGFANSIVAPAVEFRSEKIITGTCTKMFSIAGPVIVFGLSASVVYGLVYWICTVL